MGQDMVLTQDKTLAQSQRIQVEREDASNVKIRVESYDPKLGWYPSASISLPLHQLALLEQSIQDMRRGNAGADCEDNIIPFPG